MEQVDKYFKESMKNIFVLRTLYSPKRENIISFNDYLDMRFKDSCYYYSAFALMGLNKGDLIIRGCIDVNETGYSGYEHGWVEFMYEGVEYVFDNLLPTIITKEEYYRRKRPKVIFKTDLDYVLREFTSSYNSEKIGVNKYRVKDFSLYHNYCYNDPSHLYVVLSDSIITFGENRSLVKKFIGKL